MVIFWDPMALAKLVDKFLAMIASLAIQLSVLLVELPKFCITAQVIFYSFKETNHV